MAEIYGHRGFSGRYPENTLLSFEKAADLGCAGVELDVQLTRDGEVVVIHDERVDRTTNGSGFVREFTLDALQSLDARGAFKDSAPLQRVPTLREYLQLARSVGWQTNIEIKTGVFEYPGIEEKTLELVREYGLTDKVRYSSFNHYSMRRVKALCPEAMCGLLIDCWIVGIGAYAKSLGMQTVNGPTPYFKKEIVDELHNAGLLAMAWTPNTKEQLGWLADNGVDVLITNFPDLGLQVLSDRKGG